jgi:hypothetical protein
MNLELQLRAAELSQLSRRQNTIATEGLMLFKTDFALIRKFTSLVSDISNFISGKVVSGFLPTITLFSAKDTEITKLKRALDTYDYLSLRLNEFRIPQGLGLGYIDYTKWLIGEAHHCQEYIDETGTSLISTIADITRTPNMFSGNAPLPKLKLFDKSNFDRGVKKAFTKGGQSKTRWMNLVKRNGDFLVVLDLLSELNEYSIVRDYEDYVKLSRDYIDRVDKFVTAAKSDNSQISLSPKNISLLSDYILSLAKAIEVFGLLTAFINDFVVCVSDNKKQLIDMR